MKKLILTLMSVAVFSPVCAKPQTVELDIPGMTCAVCPITIKAAIQKVDGIISVETSLTDKSARVVFDNNMTNISAIEKSTTDAGYPSTAR